MADNLQPLLPIVHDEPAPAVSSPFGYDMTPPEPVEGDVLQSAFRMENAVVGAFDLITRPQYDYDPDHNPLETIKGTRYEEQYLDRFTMSYNADETRDIMGRIDREEEDRQVLAEAGAGGMLAAMLAGTADPTILLPIGGWLAPVAKGGKATTVALRAAEGAAVTGASVAAQEAILQGAQETRAPGESMGAVAAGTLLGGILGGGIAALTKEQASEAGARLFGSMPATRAEEVQAFDEAVKATSAGAAVTAEARGSGELKPAFGAEKALAFQDPSFRTMANRIEAARNTGRDLFETPQMLAENADGIATSIGGSVETRIKMWTAGLGQFVQDYDAAWLDYWKRTTGKGRFSSGMARFRGNVTAGPEGLDYKAFQLEVSRALRSGDQSPIPEAQRAAESYRKNIDDPLKQGAIDVGLLPENVQVEGDVSHLFRVYRREVIAARRPEFANILVQHFQAGQEAASKSVRAMAKRLEEKQFEIEQSKAEVADALERFKARQVQIREAQKAGRADARDADKALKEAQREYEKATRAAQRARDRMYRDLLADLKRGRPAGSQAPDLVQFIKSKGGIRLMREDAVGRERFSTSRSAELRDVVGKSRGILRSDGLDPDAMLRLAQDEGYISAEGGLDDLVEGVDLTLKGRPVFSVLDEEAVAAVENIRALVRELEQRGIDLEDLTPEDLARVMGEGAPESSIDARTNELVLEVRAYLGDADIELSPEGRALVDSLSEREKVAATSAAGSDGVAAAGDSFRDYLDDDLLEEIDSQPRDNILADVTRKLREGARQIAEQEQSSGGGPPKPVVSGELPAAVGGGGLNLPPRPAGTVRYYHSGDEYTGGARWLGIDETYVNYRSGARAFYVDVKKSELPEDAVDEINGSYRSFEAPEAIARRMVVINESALRKKPSRANQVGSSTSVLRQAVQDIEDIAGRFDDATIRVEDINRLADDLKELAPDLVEMARASREAVREVAKEVNQLQRSIANASEYVDLTADELLAATDEVIETILGTHPNRMTTVTDLVAGPRGPLKERTLRIPSNLIEDFIENDPEILARLTIRSMAPDIELKAKFGDIDLTGQINAINDEAANLARAAESDAERTRIRKAQTDAIRDLTHIRDRLRGTAGVPSDPSSLITRTSRTVRNLNYLRLLGGMTLSAVPDPGRIVMVYGIQRSFGAPLRGLILQSASYKAAKKEALLAGTGWDMRLDTRSMAIADLTDDFGQGSAFERGLAGATRKFGLVSLMAPWNAELKGITAVIAQTKLFDLMQKLTNGKATKKEVEYLAQGSIDANTAERIWRQFKAHGKNEDGIRWANSTAWDDRFAVESFRAFLVREVDRVIVTPGMDRPIWMDSETGKLIGQFRSFGIASVQRTLIAGLQQRDAAVLNGVMLMVALGMMSYVTKQAAAGRDISNDPAVWITEGIDRSGVLAWLSDINNVAEKATGGRVGMSALTGEQASRYASRNIIGAIIGPTAGTITDAAAVTRALATGEVSESDVRAVRRLLPAQNLFYLRHLLNQVEAGAGEAIGVEVQ